MFHTEHESKDRLTPSLAANVCDGRNRSNISIGSIVKIVQKQDRAKGKVIEGRVLEILTNSSFHPRGIKVRLEDGRVGRIREICIPR